MVKKTKKLSVSMVEPSSSAEPQTPRKRGRPRKVVTGSNEEQQTTQQEQVIGLKKPEDGEQVLEKLEEGKKKSGEVTEVEGSSSSKSGKDVDDKELSLLQRPQEQPLRRSRAKKKSKPTRSS